MAAAQGVQTRTQYILPFFPSGKTVASVNYQSNLSKKAQNKLKAFQIYNMKKLSMRDIGEIFGVDKSTVSRWIKQVRKAKEIRRYQYLEVKSKRPLNTPRSTVLTSKVKKSILTIREKYKCGKDKIAKYLKRDYNIEISPSTIHRFLKKLPPSEDPKLHNKVSRNPKYQRKKRKLIRFKDIEDNLERRAFEHFQIDTKYWTINGYSFYIVAAIDVVTRMLFARAYTTHSSNAAKDFLERLDFLFDIKHSKAYLQRDNGSEFMGQFETKAKEYAITLVTNYVRTPQMNGFIERLNRSIKEEVLEYHIPSTISEANEHLHQYLIVYNFERIHDGLEDDLTPFEKVCELKFKKPFDKLLNSAKALLHFYRTSTSSWLFVSFMLLCLYE
jgi:transposase InsO family protein